MQSPEISGRLPGSKPVRASEKWSQKKDKHHFEDEDNFDMLRIIHRLPKGENKHVYCKS